MNLEKTLTKPYIAKHVDLDITFEMFVCQGSEIIFGEDDQNTLELTKLEIKSVLFKQEYIGSQFFFHFRVANKKRKETIVLAITEPQNMAIDDYVDSIESAEALSYKISFIDFNFSIPKNTITLMIEKI